jgi:hypothetical protein
MVSLKSRALTCQSRLAYCLRRQSETDPWIDCRIREPKIPSAASRAAQKLEEEQMFFISPGNLQHRLGKLSILPIGTLILIAFASGTSRAQRTRTALDEPEGRPAFSDFRGVRIGMTADETRKKLGNPRDKSAEQDLYVYNDTQVVQIFYDKGSAVTAISIDYMSGASGIPSAKEVLGAEAEAKADGSIYKLVRYPKAGYWVSYSRTAGNEPTTTVTIQKIEH